MKKYRVIENGIRILCEIEAVDLNHAIQIVKVKTGIPSVLLCSDIYRFEVIDE